MFANDYNEFSRIFLGVYFSIVAIFYTLRIILTKKKYKKEIVFPGERFCATWWNHYIFRFLRMAIWLICLIRIPVPSIDLFLGVIHPLVKGPIIITGNLFLLVSFVSILTINLYLNKNWRSGIDPDHSTDLWTKGIYKYSRNPMFLGVYLGQIGFFLALPSAFSLVCLLIGFAAVYRQMLEEEKYLGQKFDQQYAKYKQQVPRWLFG